MIEERVRKALTLKDELVNSLKLQLEDLGIKNAHLERLIDKQRQVTVEGLCVDSLRWHSILPLGAPELNLRKLV